MPCTAARAACCSCRRHRPNHRHPPHHHRHEAFLGIAEGKRTSTWHEQEVKDLGTGLAGRRVEAQAQGHKFATMLKPHGFMSIQARERWSTTEEVHVRPGHFWVAQVRPAPPCTQPLFPCMPLMHF